MNCEVCAHKTSTLTSNSCGHFGHGQLNGEERERERCVYSVARTHVYEWSITILPGSLFMFAVRDFKIIASLTQLGDRESVINKNIRARGESDNLPHTPGRIALDHALDHSPASRAFDHSLSVVSCPARSAAGEGVTVCPVLGLLRGKCFVSYRSSDDSHAVFQIWIFQK